MSNGCGPKFLPKFVTDLLFNWFFESPCIKHDEGYTSGGNEVDRFQCDWELLQGMLKGAKQVRGVFKPLAYIEALLFFVLVRLFGWLFFNYSRERDYENKH